MAALRRLREGSIHQLLSRSSVGRGPNNHLRVDNRVSSIFHSELRWTRTGWKIHDLDSSNGTFVDGMRIGKGEHRGIRAGTTIAFGDLDDPFELFDDRPPIAHAIDPRGRRHDADGQMLVLPDDHQPTHTIFEDMGKWLCEASDGQRQIVNEGGTLTIGVDTWTLHLPHFIEPTWSPYQGSLLLPDITLRFSVSPSEEHIELSLAHSEGIVELAPRVHMELLYRLAQSRLEDRGKPEISQVEEGWMYIPELLKELGLKDDASSRNLLCQHIYQARRQFVTAEVVGAIDIIQRRNTIATEGRARIGQIRTGATVFEIEHR